MTVFPRKNCMNICSKMMSLRRCVSSTWSSPSKFQHALAITARQNFSTEITEKAEELRLSYLTGDKQGICVIEMNRQEGKNSLNKSLSSKLQSAVDVVSHDKNVRVVIIRRYEECLN